MKILITGHEGFIGQNMVEHFERLGITVYGLEKHDQIPTPAFFRELDAVVHLGAETSTTAENMQYLLKNNVDFSVRLYQHYVTYKNPSKKTVFQYASSASVYGDTGYFYENGWKQPLNKYGLSKFNLDLCLGHLPGVQGFRYFNVYGPHEECKGEQASPIHKFHKQATEEGKIKIFDGSEGFYRDFVSVRDICRVHWAMLTSGFEGIMNLGTGRAVSFLHLAREFRRHTGCEIVNIPMPRDLAKHYQPFTRATLIKFREYLPNYKWEIVEDNIEKKCKNIV